ncbi:hypothetical protein ABW20_dc0110237 [Dactylellina cionopaga]|nr:hypothetical protein ABW20_dc0110237 [Dactylellina cionopaga]
MNAQSYLQSYGWTPGAPLGNDLSHLPSSSDPSSSSSNRLTKRILTSAKNNTLGVGRKPSNLNHADLWWEKAFDVSLKNLDVNKDTSAVAAEKKEVVDNMNLFAELGGGRGFGGTAVAGGGGSGKKKVDATGPLYRYFVKGEGLEGTVTSTILAATATATATTTTTVTAVGSETTLEDKRSSKKRKLDDTDAESASKSEIKAQKIERKRLRAERRAAKTERRRLRAERRVLKEEKKKKKLKAAKKADKKQRKEKSTVESIASSTTSEEEEEEEQDHRPGVQSDSGVDISSDETPVEEIPILDKKEKRKDKKHKETVKAKSSNSKKDKKKEKSTRPSKKIKASSF